MKYRVQLWATFNNTDANTILNHVESIKTLVYKPSEYTPVEIIRRANKCEHDSDFEGTEFATVDFDGPQETHNGSPSGVTEFDVHIDVSFSVQQDQYDLLNYIESIKSNANSSYLRHCRFFDCNHDEDPLVKDGAYSYIDFDGPQETHPIS